MNSLNLSVDMWAIRTDNVVFCYHYRVQFLHYFRNEFPTAIADYLFEKSMSTDPFVKQCLGHRYRLFISDGYEFRVSCECVRYSKDMVESFA